MQTFNSQRSGYTLRDLLVAIAAIGLMLAVLLPWIHSQPLGHRRNACVNRMKQLVLALHNYHDVYKRQPHLTSTQIRGVAPGSVPSADNPGAGYSWIVAILPYMEETTLHKSIERESKNFTLPPFDPSVKPPPYAFANTPPSFAAIDLDALRCPSRSTEEFAAAPEYAALGKNMVSGCSYVALSATHLDCMLGNPKAPDYIEPNGILIPGPTVIDFRDIKDGTSKTFMLVETREENYSSWYDGTVAWVVATNVHGAQPMHDGSGFLYLDASGSTAINIGPRPNPATPYLPKSLHPDLKADWQWGPSSEHAGMFAIHGVADGSVRDITEDIDPTLYMQLITRAGNEPVNLPE